MNFTKDFLNYANYKSIAFLLFDLNSIPKIDLFINEGVKIDYIINLSNDSTVGIPSSYNGIPIYKSSHLSELKIDLILTDDFFPDSTHFNTFVQPYKLDLIDIKNFSYYDNLINNNLPKLDNLLHKTNVNLIIFLATTTYRLSNPSQREMLLQKTGNIFIENKNMYEPQKAFDDLNLTNENILQLTNASLNWERKFQSLANYSSEYCNVIEGNRFLPNVPDNYDNSIYTFGGCTSRGILAKDENTTAAFLQNKLNKFSKIQKNNSIKTKSYRVVNVWNTMTLENFPTWLNTINYKAGDVFFTLAGGNRMFSQKLFEYINRQMQKANLQNILFFDSIEVFNNLKNIKGEFFVDNLHYSHKGYKATAEKLYEIIINMQNDNENLLAKQVFVKQKNASNSFVDSLAKDTNLQTYLEQLKKIQQENINYNKIGAVVVNCNPFTNGHKYLIEKAAQKVDFLYIFVVEENRSFFSFTDRKLLVEKGTSHLKNIQILPSGHFIISKFTFPGYFTKEEIAPEIDSSFDVEIFGKYVCPALNIKYRFVGTEPYCPVTKAYNNSLKELLPFYNVQLIELERFDYNGTSISATNIRKLLQEKHFDKIKKLVPITTYDFLVKNFFDKNL